MERALAGLSLLCAIALGFPAIAGTPPLEDLMQFPTYEGMIVSPGGDYLATTLRHDGVAAVAVLDIRDRANIGVSATFRPGGSENPASLTWVRDDRLAFTTTIREGTLAQEFWTGRIYAIDADGRNSLQLYGNRPGEISAVGRAATILHRIPNDSGHILISTLSHDVERPIAMRLHLNLRGRTRNAGTSPLPRGGLLADYDGVPRFAYGSDDDLRQLLAWRPDDTDSWRTFNSPFDHDLRVWGFTAEGDAVYVSARDDGKLGVYRIHLESGRFERLLADDTFEAIHPIWNAAEDDIIGAIFATPRPEARFFDPDEPTARLWRSLADALPEHFVRITGFTDDGSLAIVHASSDREPGVYFALEVEALRLTELVASKAWIDPAQLAEKRPISFTARDGLELHGFLSLPPGSDGKDLPMIVYVHGGPYGVRDRWFYEADVQAMATRGYAVLQINYRGSGGRGARFERGAYMQWGAEMQDDITDGTLWAIDEGIAHPDRVCLAGASYGGYSTLSGLTREPDLYRCGFAFVGVYDMPLMKRRGNVPRWALGRTYLAQILGTDDELLHERSPVNFVDRITADLFVAHGAADKQADVSQYHSLTRALERADIPHEQLLVPREGHGFVQLENRVDLHERALEFFDRNIGAGWRPRAD